VSEQFDILLPLGDGSRHGNVELRFALRSIERHCRGYSKIVVVGIDPGFLAPHPRLKFVPRSDFPGNKEARIAQKLAWAFEHAVETGYAVLWNDDYVIQRRVDVRRLPFYHGLSLPESAARHNGGRYKRSLSLTAEFLENAGRPAWNYDLHLPMIFNRERFLALDHWWRVSRRSSCGLVVKSIYANVHLDAPGPQTTDCKLRWCRDGSFRARIARRWCYSYSDESLDSGLRAHLEAEFPRRSEFEAR